MSDSVPIAAQRYRLAPRDTTGVAYGLGFSQVAIVAVGLAIGFVLLMTRGPLLATLVGLPIVAIGAANLNGLTVVDLAPLAWRWVSVRGDDTWWSSVPTLGPEPRSTRPECLRDLDVLAIDNTHFGHDGPSQTAVVHDTAASTLSITMRVTGSQFHLVDPVVRDRRLREWGAAIQAFANDGSGMIALRWSEFCAPSGIDDHARWVRSQLAADPLADATDRYRTLLAEGAAVTTAHETLVTLTYNAAGARARRGVAGLEPTIATMLSECSLFADRLRQAGLGVSPPLSPEMWARAMRHRLDPIDSPVPSVATVSVDNAFPTVSQLMWRHWRCDGTVHRTFLVTEWPRFDVAADWMGPLLQYSGGARSITVVLEPVNRFVTQRRLKRASARIESDSDARRRVGARVGAQHRRAKADVDELEADLVNGHIEFAFAGLVVASGADDDDLERTCDELTQVAGSTGIELRPLYARHDQAVVASLPVARGIVRT